MRTNKLWTQKEAVALCRQLEVIAPLFGGHVALTGGTLYKDGERRDVDIMIYRSADEPEFDWEGFFLRIKDRLGIEQCADYGYCKKARTATGARIDFFDPFRGGEKVSDSDE